MRKHKHFKVLDFLHISHEAEIHTIPKPWVNSHITEQVWENTGNSQVFLFLTDLELLKTHAIPSV